MIRIAHKGISMNIIVYQRPTHIYCLDSCPAGLGGYSDSGFAWRYYLCRKLQFRATNNLLKHIAAIITPWVDIIQGRLRPGDCALSMTDSTTLEGWLGKTNFSKLKEDPEQATVRLEVARMHATHYFTLGIREYSQWFKGKDNVVADSLSCDNDQMGEELTKLFSYSLPITDSGSFQNSTPAQQNCFMADCIAAQAAIETAVTGKTHQDQAWLWKRWTTYCSWIGLEDPFLDNFTCHAQIKPLGAFAMAMQEAYFSRSSHVELAKGSISSAISHVSQTFCEHGRPNPTLDNNRKTGFLLQRELRAFKKGDPAEKHEKAILMSVISALPSNRSRNSIGPSFSSQDWAYSLPSDLVNISKFYRPNNVRHYKSG